MERILESPKIFGYVIACLIIAGWWIWNRFTARLDEAPPVERPRRRLLLDEL
tara:strand:+ start:341 stop:496 length:156 start_codon:yes stop_codon:yes gene_type:complete